MRMDNGPELISAKLADWVQEHGVILEVIQPGKPTQNSFIERFNRTYWNEVMDITCSGNYRRFWISHRIGSRNITKRGITTLSAH